MLARTARVPGRRGSYLVSSPKRLATWQFAKLRWYVHPDQVDAAPFGLKEDDSRSEVGI